MKQSVLATAASLVLLLGVGAATVAANGHTHVVAHAKERNHTIHVVARVNHPDRGTSFSAAAVVHFTAGDVHYALHRRGQSFVASRPIHLTSTQALSPLHVTVQVDYGQASDAFDLTTEDDHGDDPGASAEPTDGPDGTEHPEGTERPHGTERPDGTESPDSTETPDGTESPDSTETPDGTESPDGTEAPDGTEHPDGTETPDSSEAPDDGD